MAKVEFEEVQTVQTQNCINLTLAGNSTSAGAGYALMSSGTVTLAGGNNITLSQNGNAVTIIGGAGGAGGTFDGGVITLGNSLGTTGTVNAEIVFVGGNNITLSQSINLQSATITISGPNAQTGISGIAGSGASTATSGTVQFANSNNITFGLNGNTITASASFSQTAEPRVISLNGTSGSLSLSGASNITVSALNGSTITIYGPSNILNSLSVSGNTGTTGSSNITGGGFVIAGGSNITLSQSNNTISIHGAAAGSSGIVLVSNTLITASTDAIDFTGADASHHVYTFHMYISNPLSDSHIYSIMYNGVTGSCTRQFFFFSSASTDAARDNVPIAFALTGSEVGHGIVHMFFHTTPLRMYYQGGDMGTAILNQLMLQDATAATAVTKIMISADSANAIGPNSRILWYRNG